MLTDNNTSEEKTIKLVRCPGGSIYAKKGNPCPDGIIYKTEVVVAENSVRKRSDDTYVKRSTG